MNLVIDSVLIDTYKLINIFNFVTLWNYPEAYVTPTFTVNNLTGIRSDRDPEDFVASFIYISSPGNMSFSNWDMRTVYTLSSQLRANTFITVSADCNPDDGLLKTVDIDTVDVSLENNDDFSKTNVFAVDIGSTSYRNTKTNVTRFNSENWNGGPYGPFGIGGPPGTYLYYSNSVHKNYTGLFFLAYFQEGSKSI